MNKETISFPEIKDAYYDESFDKLPKELTDKIEAAMNSWYCQQDFDTVEKLTDFSIWSIPEGNKRERALDNARMSWNQNSTELKFGKFIEEEGYSAGTVLAELIKNL
jgi:hypothetical protein